MAIAYPLAMPEHGRFASITLRPVNVVAVSRSPFTLAQQVQRWPGHGWEASVTLPRMSRADAQRWAAWMTALRGQFGSFLLGDRTALRLGTAAAATITGAVGDETVAVVMTGSLRAGDLFQLGAGATATLHQVLADQDGDGTLEIWPALRRAVTDAPVVLDQPRGLFRLDQSHAEWTILVDRLPDGMTFAAIEVL